MIKVLIDPGHAPGNANKGPTGYYEYQGVWKISTYLKEILVSKGVQVDFTRTWDEDPSLYDRGKKAAGYDLFISEHTNANDGKTRGVEVFYDYSKPQDKELANKLAGNVASVMGNANRGAKTRIYTEDGKIYNYYGVIRRAAATDCKHILIIESGFHDNAIDEAYLKVNDNIKKISKAQAKIICEYLEVKDEMEREVVRYKNLSEMPVHYQAAVKDLIDKKVIQGNVSGDLNMTEDMVRILIMASRMDNLK